MFVDSDVDYAYTGNVEGSSCFIVELFDVFSVAKTAEDVGEFFFLLFRVHRGVVEAFFKHELSCDGFAVFENVVYFVYDELSGAVVPLYSFREFDVGVGGKVVNNDAYIFIVFVESVDTDNGSISFIFVDIP